MGKKSFKELFKSAETGNNYWIADAKYTFAEDLDRLAAVKKVSRADLARRLDTSPAYITKIFRGNANFTISTMVKVVRSLGGRLHLHVSPEGPDVSWLYIYKQVKHEPTTTWLDRDIWSFQSQKEEGEISASAD
ncbi:MAG: helix-turn-helix transcriptional regulator [bacterium]|nr:helix-turn-helix transcriptional regulator [bacterium]